MATFDEHRKSVGKTERRTPRRRRSGALHASLWLTCFLFAFADAFVPRVQGQLVADGVTNTLNNVTTNVTGTVTVGTNGTKTALILTNAAFLTNTLDGMIGRNTGANTNYVFLTGTNTRWLMGGNLSVGSNGAFNQLVISNNALVANSYGYVGYGSSSSNNLAVVTGGGSLWNNSSNLNIGYAGAGNRLVVSNGAMAKNSTGLIGNSSSNNLAVITGAGSLWTNLVNLIVGSGGPFNQLVVSNGARVSVNSVGYLGLSADNNLALVTGAGSVWSNKTGLRIGENGASNRLVLTNGGTAYGGNQVVIGFNSSALNNRIVNAGGSLIAAGTPGIFDVRRGTNEFNSGLIDVNQLWMTNTLGVFEFNGGTLITRGGLISNSAPFVVGNSGTTPAIWDVRSGTANAVVASKLVVGLDVANSQLLVTNGQTLSVSAAVISSVLGGNAAASNSMALISGPSSAWLNSGSLVVGSNSIGNQMVISNSASVGNSDGYLGMSSPAVGNTVVVSGAGAVWNSQGDLRVGNNGSGNRLMVSAGGRVENSTGWLGALSGASNEVIITDAGSLWSNRFDLYVGDFGNRNRLVVTNGGQVINGTAYIGYSSPVTSTNNEVVVTGSGSLWSNRLELYVGGFGRGNRLVVGNGGTVFASNGIYLSLGVNSTSDRIEVTDANLLVGNGAGTGALDIRRGTNQFNSGLVDVDQLLMTNALGVFEFNGGTLRTKQSIVANGLPFVVGNGTSSAIFELLGNGTHSFSNGLQIANNALLKGNGTVFGNVSVGGGGVFSPGASIGKLAIAGNLTLAAGSTNVFELNKTSGTNDNVVGLTNVTYGGTLLVTNLSGTLAHGDAFKLFSAASYSGAFSGVSPAAPGPDVAWNTNTLAVDGVLRVVSTSAPPAITSQPQSATNVTGTTANFTVTVSGGEPLYYQWRRYGTNLAGATNAIYSVASVQTNDAGPYVVVVTNISGSVTSDVATLTVWLPPSITEQPQSATNAAGTTVMFGVTAAGTEPLTYHWRKGGVDLADGGNVSGATSTLLTLTNLSLADEADYTVLVTNVAGSITSSVATLTVQTPPQITSQPQSSTNGAGTPVLLSVTATGSPTLRYQWWKDSLSVLDATNDTYSIASVSVTNAGDYFVIVTNSYGSATSQVATVTVTNETGTDIVWTNAVSGSWHDATNWSPNKVPGPLDSATIALGVTVTVGSSAVVSNLAFASATLDGSGVLTVNGTMDWNSGTFTSLTIASSGVLNVIGSGTRFFSGNTLTNHGTVVWTNGTIYGDSAALIHNAGLWQMQGDLSVFINSGSSTFINTGTFQKSGGSGQGTVNWSFTTTGLMDATNGALTLGNWTGSNVLNGALNWSGGTMNGTARVTSNSVVNWIAGGTISGPFTLEAGAGLNLGGGSSRFLSGGTLTNYGTVNWTNGTLYGESGAVIHNAGHWQMQNDLSLLINSGAGTFINTGTFEKNGGTGTADIGWAFNTTGIMDAQTGWLQISQWFGDNRLHGTLNWKGTFTASMTIETNGTLNLTSSSTRFFSGSTLTNHGTVLWADGTLYGDSGAIIHNAGLWQMQDDLSLLINSGSSTFINSGTVQKNGGSGQGALDWSFTTTGLMDATNGSLHLGNWTGSNVFNGALNWSGGTMSGTARVTSNSVVNWIGGGTMSGVMTVDNGGALNLSGGSTKFFSGGALTNYGTATWTNGTIYGDSGFVVHNSGLWQIQDDLSLLINSGASTFVNTGALQKNGGAGTAEISWDFHTSGELDLLAGTLRLSSQADQTSGLTLLTTGNLQVSQPFQLLGGVLAGTNTVVGTLVNNGGTVSPGLSPGKLTIQGSYTQTTNGTLQIELAGYSPGGSFDKLEVTSTAILDGTLNIAPTNGFTPTNNAVFTFLTAAELAGTFSHFNYPSNTLGMEAGYSGISAFVQITNVASGTPTVVSGPFLDSGDIVVRFSGLPGETYTIEYTDTLSPPNWQKATNLIAPTTDMGLGIGVFEFRESLLPTGQRYYRAAYPAY